VENNRNCSLGVTLKILQKYRLVLLGISPQKAGVYKRNQYKNSDGNEMSKWNVVYLARVILVQGCSTFLREIAFYIGGMQGR
jgi:hypothetical protein